MQRSPSQEENKLLILYCFEKIGAMTATQLTRFLMEHAMMEYLDLQILLGELVENRLILRSAQDIGLYNLSKSGAESLALFGSDLPYSRKQAVDAIAKEWRGMFRDEQQIRTEIWPDTDSQGGAVAEMLVVEGSALQFSLRLRAPSTREARALTKRFRERSTQVYQAVLQELLKEEQE